MTRSLILFAALWPLWLQAADSAADPQPSVLVKLQPVQQRQLRQILTAYGKASPDPDAVSAVNTGHEVIVSRLRVTAGQKVREGDKLATLETAPAARQAYLQAEADAEFAREDLARKQRLLKQQLATRADVAAAGKALKSANAALRAQRALGNDKTSTAITAPFPGVVTDVAVSPGQRLQAGSPVMSLAHTERLIVRLGVEPDLVPDISTGAPVHLERIFGGGPGLDTHITQVQGVVDPSTRLVDVLVRLQGKDAARFLPGMQLRGRITTADVNTLAVPHSAVLNDDDGDYIFVVRGGTAHRVNVKTGIRTDLWTGIAGGGVRAGDRVVVEGNYELDDGVPVREGSE